MEIQFKSYYVKLPDGTFERVSKELIPDDVELEPIEDPDAKFAEVTFAIARRRLRRMPYKDGDTIWFGHIEPSADRVISQHFEPQVRYWMGRLRGQDHDAAFAYVALAQATGQDDPGVPRDGDGEPIFGLRGLPQIVSRDLPTQVRYTKMRLDGQSHNMAEMLATRSFPGLKTDSIFNEGRFSGKDQFADTPAQGAWLRAQAEAAGVSTTGKYYLSGLADFPGDPTAWVSDRGDVLRVAREKNLRILDGYVTHEPVERPAMADTEIAPDIIENEVLDILDSNPGLKEEAVRDRVYALRTGRVDESPSLVKDYTEADIAATV